jgi:hypothetical protein
MSEADRHGLDAVYRERAHLVAHLAALYPSHILFDDDPSKPGWRLIYIDTPTGQMAWHLSHGDMGLFPHVPRAASNEVEWDGHTTDEKYHRLRQLTKDKAAQR